MNKGVSARGQAHAAREIVVRLEHRADQIELDDGLRTTQCRDLCTGVRVRGLARAQRTGRAGDEPYIRGAVDLAIERGVPVVATNDVRFIRREDFDAHEVRVSIHEGVLLEDPKRPRRYSEQQYLRSPEEMAALALSLDLAMREHAPAGWKCDEPREKEVLNALFPLMSRDRAATQAIFEIIKNQPGY